MDENGFKEGFLLVKKYSVLYYEYSQKYNLEYPKYGIPQINKIPQDFKINYRGIDRDPLYSFENGELLAQTRLHELEMDSKSCFDFIFDYQDVSEVYEYLGSKKDDYEIIWVRIFGASESFVPEGFTSVGYESSYFYGDHFSASCDCMLIPRWHGTDEQGIIFSEYYNKLNQYGLFNCPQESEAFINYYLSFDWTERGNFYTTEVFIMEN